MLLKVRTSIRREHGVVIVLVPLATCGGSGEVALAVAVEVATATETPATLATVAPVPFVAPRPSINTTYIRIVAVVVATWKSIKICVCGDLAFQMGTAKIHTERKVAG